MVQQQKAGAATLKIMALAAEAPKVEPTTEDQKEGEQLLWEAEAWVQLVGAASATGRK